MHRYDVACCECFTGAAYSSRYWKAGVFDALAIVRAACDVAGIPMAAASLRWAMHHSVPPSSQHGTCDMACRQNGGGIYPFACYLCVRCCRLRTATASSSARAPSRTSRRTSRRAATGQPRDSSSRIPLAAVIPFMRFFLRLFTLQAAAPAAGRGVRRGMGGRTANVHRLLPWLRRGCGLERHVPAQAPGHRPRQRRLKRCIAMLQVQRWWRVRVSAGHAICVSA